VDASTPSGWNVKTTNNLSARCWVLEDRETENQGPGRLWSSRLVCGRFERKRCRTARTL